MNQGEINGKMSILQTSDHSGKITRESADSIEEVHKEVSGVVKKEIMYSCPHCEAILGFGFFVGGLLTGRP